MAEVNITGVVLRGTEAPLLIEVPFRKFMAQLHEAKSEWFEEKGIDNEHSHNFLCSFRREDVVLCIDVNSKTNRNQPDEPSEDADETPDSD